MSEPAGKDLQKAHEICEYDCCTSIRMGLCPSCRKIAQALANERAEAIAKTKEKAAQVAVWVDVERCCKRLKDGSHVPHCTGEVLEEAAEYIRDLTEAEIMG